MIGNIFEYIITADVYYQLWMVAQATNPVDGQPAFNGTKNVRHHSEGWHPALISQFNDVRDVPATITVSNAEHQLDGESRFHAGNNKPTLKIDKMTLTWGHKFPTRELGPCEIVLSGVKLWHHQGQLHRRRGDAVIVEQAKFCWNNRNKEGYFREFGPFQVEMHRITAQAHLVQNGEETTSQIVAPSFRKLNTSWANDSGARLGETRIKEVMTKHDIKVNYLMAGPTVFADEGEEFIFFDELGGEL